ncbi:restriction endonuclease [Piscirickettsia salmonis]|uniref:restriction endonuclease n=1 Tax=Piscirickettsia salmonis TaxID=1238 RepID=UPI0002D9CE6C|nr:restriction endonuclease [Piscirickettsia salmonis]APS58383.1 hypothetical protein AVI52_14815 [Piscirickettsia salmonis]ERL61524.1 restriction endonuclease family protein [Piscirickettsia salmonis LF-89 = ATCC VR-1361]PEQ17426.1 restriction endonuclease [Piscirickettsia salmonis]QGN76722.1 Restriction endonuclease [Piscirickettsia salmonis]QGN80312.1 Restriction endonuclease [Piscirickettsia salmonis]
MQLKDIVKDWGGFERLVADLHKDGEVDVLHDITLIGASGASRQIDVMIKHKKGVYEYLTLVECKYWKKKVERSHVDVLYASIQDLNASKGIFFTTRGYQSGAEKYAKSKGITIFVVRELTDQEWGMPGKTIDIYLQSISKTIISVKPIDTKILSSQQFEARKNYNLEIKLGDNQKSENIIISKHKDKYKTLESAIEYATIEGIKKFQKKSLLINGGEECTRYLQTKLNINFSEDIVIYNQDNAIFLPRAEITIRLKIAQSRIIIDRSSNYKYAFAVADHINNQQYSISKHNNFEYSEWSELKQKNDNSKQQYLQNGSILSILIDGYFDQKEMKDLKLTPMKELVTH